MSLVLSTAMFVGVLLYVFLPRRKTRALAAESSAEHLIEKRDVLYGNLRELNFEFKAGKYLEENHAVQRDSLQQEAAMVVAGIRAAENTRSSS